MQTTRFIWLSNLRLSLYKIGRAQKTAATAKFYWPRKGAETWIDPVSHYGERSSGRTSI
jgi:hypothetical protein